MVIHCLTSFFSIFTLKLPSLGFLIILSCSFELYGLFPGQTRLYTRFEHDYNPIEAVVYIRKGIARICITRGNSLASHKPDHSGILLKYIHSTPFSAYGSMYMKMPLTNKKPPILSVLYSLLFHLLPIRILLCPCAWAWAGKGVPL